MSNEVDKNDSITIFIKYFLNNFKGLVSSVIKNILRKS